MSTQVASDDLVGCGCIGAVLAAIFFIAYSFGTTNVTTTRFVGQPLEEVVRLELDNARQLGFVLRGPVAVDPAPTAWHRVDLRFGECVAFVAAPTDTVSVTRLTLTQTDGTNGVTHDRDYVYSNTSNVSNTLNGSMVLSIQYCAGFPETQWLRVERTAAAQTAVYELRRAREGLDMLSLNRGNVTPLGVAQEARNASLHWRAAVRFAKLKTLTREDRIVDVSSTQAAVAPASSERARSMLERARLGAMPNTVARAVPGDGVRAFDLTGKPLAWVDGQWWRVIAAIDARATNAAMQVRVESLESETAPRVFRVSDRSWTTAALSSSERSAFDTFAESDEARLYLVSPIDDDVYLVSIGESRESKMSRPVGGPERIALDTFVAPEVVAAEQECTARRFSGCLTLSRYVAVGLRASRGMTQLADAACSLGRAGAEACLEFARGELADGNGVAALAHGRSACDAGNVRACRMFARRARKGDGVPQDVSVAQTLYERACARKDGASCENARVLRWFTAD